jgi:hypothetical protein
MIRNFINALQFLTIVTVNKKHLIEEGDLAKSMVYFPVIGFIGFVLVYADKVFALLVCLSPSETYLCSLSPSWSRGPCNWTAWRHVRRHHGRAQRRIPACHHERQQDRDRGACSVCSLVLLVNISALNSLFTVRRWPRS